MLCPRESESTIEHSILCCTLEDSLLDFAMPIGGMDSGVSQRPTCASRLAGYDRMDAMPEQSHGTYRYLRA